MEKPAMAAIAVLIFSGTSVVLAHGDNSDDGHDKSDAMVVKEQKPWGIAADPGEAERTIEVRMLDAMRFEPARLEVAENETVRFVVSNAGELMHEFVLGTQSSNDEHAELMKRFPNMEHDEPYMAHVPPGETREIVWTFNRAGDYAFACLIAGHYQAGMVGDLSVGDS